MRYFADRSLGSRILPTHLREAGWIVETMDERYGIDRSQSIADITWINDLGRDEVALTSDRKIGKVPLQSEAILRASARILIVDANLTAPDQAARLLASASRLDTVIFGRPGPWVVSVGADALRDVRLSGGARPST